MPMPVIRLVALATAESSGDPSPSIASIEPSMSASIEMFGRGAAL